MLQLFVTSVRSDDVSQSSLLEWCNSNTFLKHLDHVKKNFPSQYKFCSTKASTCTSLARKLKLDDKFISKVKLDHRQFLKFCEKINLEVKYQSHNLFNEQNQYIVITVDLIIDYSTTAFLYKLFQSNNPKVVDDYVSNLLADSGRILTEGIPNRKVIYKIIRKVNVALPNYIALGGQDAQAVYNRWCDYSYSTLQDGDVSSNNDEENSADMLMILSKTFTKNTNHVGYTLKNGLCSGKWSCAVIQDDGPQLTPVVIAHETAHLLGISHIEDTPKCYDEMIDTNNNIRKYFVMSEQMHASTGKFNWARCIQDQLRFIDREFSCIYKSSEDSNKLKYFSNFTTTDDSENKEDCAAFIYTPDIQCKMLFNDLNSELCAIKKRKRQLCTILSCSNPSKYSSMSNWMHSSRSSYGQHVYKCHSKSVGALDHTICANGQGECLNGRCVHRLRSRKVCEINY
ncbi:hypothetical protein GJ496_005997 [Pomphorhynchus laevis]|nr:hypothetical protein GJ496_005997 [Pomphorhynchus laevis]